MLDAVEHSVVCGPYGLKVKPEDQTLTPSTFVCEASISQFLKDGASKRTVHSIATNFTYSEMIMHFSAAAIPCTYSGRAFGVTPNPMGIRTLKSCIVNEVRQRLIQEHRSCFTTSQCYSLYEEPPVL